MAGIRDKPMNTMKNQHKIVLEAIITLYLTCGYSPTVREIMKKTGYLSTSTIHHHLSEMKALGIIDYLEDSPRTITVPGYRYQKANERRDKS